MATKAKAAPEVIELPQLDIRVMRLTLVGDSPLICNRWSVKAIREIEDKQGQKPKQAKEARDPELEYRESLYIRPDGTFGFPASAFKNAAVDACSHVDGITKVEARGAFHVIGDMVRIDGAPRRRDDMVRVGMGTAMPRYRGEFPEWSASVDIRYNARVLSAGQIINLFNTAGFAIGVGEWRPQKDGSFGMFHAQRADETTQEA